VSTHIATFASTASGSSAKPAWKSAFTGSGVACTISRRCANVLGLRPNHPEVGITKQPES
jgi:hypothetical protein